MSKNDKVHRRYRRFRKRMTVEVGLQMYPKTRYWRRRRDVQRQSVSQSGAATRKARSPMVERRVRRTTSDDVDAERRCWRASSADDGWSSSARYGGAVWFRNLYTRTAMMLFWSSSVADGRQSPWVSFAYRWGKRPWPSISRSKSAVKTVQREQDRSKDQPLWYATQNQR